MKNEQLHDDTKEDLEYANALDVLFQLSSLLDARLDKADKILVYKWQNAFEKCLELEYKWTK